MGVCFVGFVDEFGSACAPFFWSAAIFGHDAEKEINEVMHGFG
jgi:hypothetical protein